MNVSITLATTIVNGHECRATVPELGSAGAAGFDLHAYMTHSTVKIVTARATFSANLSINDWEVTHERDTIMPGERALVPTGVSMAIPRGWYGRIAPRSGLAWKSGIDVMAGVIDSDYRGVVGVILVNLSAQPFKITHGDRIAQIIIEMCNTTTLIVCTELPETSRGAAGYGSTGTARAANTVSGN